MEYEKLFKEGDYKIDWEYVESIPEFAKLKECEQNPKWHSEGNAWEHTMKCIHAAYTLILNEMYNGLDPKIAIAAVLFHDIGKGVTTEFLKGNWHAYGHEFAGEKIARRLLWNAPMPIREAICACARWHMKVLNMATSKNIVNEILEMSRIPHANWRYLTFVKHCDILGSEQYNIDSKYNDIDKVWAIYNIAIKLGVLDHEFPVYQEEQRRMVFSPNKAWKAGISDFPTVYVLIGLPGAGKNTWIERYLEENGPEDTVILSRDDIRSELGFCNDGDKVVLSPDKEDKVSEVFNERFVKALNYDKDVILNNVNLKKRYRDDFKRLAGNRLIDWQYVYIEAPTIEDNIKRRPTFDPEVLMSMRETLEWPQPDEYDKLLILKQ